jgi:hypothetical protein
MMPGPGEVMGIFLSATSTKVFPANARSPLPKPAGTLATKSVPLMRPPGPNVASRIVPEGSGTGVAM